MNGRAELLLHVLCICVRLLTRDQAMRLLGFTDKANFKRFVRNLVARGLVSEITVWAKPVPEMREPLFRSGTDATADHEVFGECIRLAHCRWAGVSAQPTASIVATRRAATIYGLNRTSLLAHELQCSHDLAVAEVCVRHIVNQLVQVEDWIGEDSINFVYGNKCIDVQLQRRVEGKKKVSKLIEIVGADYSVSKLLAVECEGKRLGVSYEVW